MAAKNKTPRLGRSVFEKDRDRAEVTVDITPTSVDKVEVDLAPAAVHTAAVPKGAALNAPTAGIEKLLELSSAERRALADEEQANPEDAGAS